MPLQNVTKIAIGWVVATGIGVAAFASARKSANTKRYKNMRVKQMVRDGELGN